MSKFGDVSSSETIIGAADQGFGAEPVEMAQADAGPATAPDGGSFKVTPETGTIVPDADNRIILAATTSIENIQIDGDDLLLVQPDGSQIRIIGGALDVPTFVIGDIELSQEALIATLKTSGFNVAAGPDNTLSVTEQTPPGSGAQFEDPNGATIGGEGLDPLNLLGDSSGSGDGFDQEVPLDENTGNVSSSLTGGVLAGEVIETLDNPGGLDADPAAATGSIAFFDPDFAETRSAEVSARTVVSQALNNGGALTPAQIDALLAGFSLNTPGGITVESTTSAGGSIDWSYVIGNEAVDFLASGEIITLSFDVRINDGVLSATQTVTVTVTGTNDQPVIEGSSVLAGAITEQTGTTGSITPLTATGEIVLSDVDLSDTHTTNQTFVSAVWSGGADQPVDPGLLVFEAVDQAAGTARWAYTVADNALDFLGAGETLTITYDVTVRDSSATANAGSVPQQVVVTITGTNDLPVITSGAQTGLVEETADVVGGVDPDPAAATGIISFLDVDLSDDPEASHDGGTVTNMAFAHGYTPTDAQIAALKAGFTLDDAALSNFSNTTGVGSTGWTYQVANDAVDFLGDGDSVELTYVVTIDDGNGGTVTQNVVVTLTGTSDAPTVSAADNFVVNEEDLTNGNSGALIFTGNVGLNFNDYSSVDLSARLKTSGAIPLDPAGDLILLSSDGQQLGYSLLTNPGAGLQRLAAFNFRTGEIIFVLEVKIVADGSGGFKVEYTFELRGNLDHIGPGDGNSMPLDFTVTATNSAGETAENTFTVTINDDAPDAVNVTATMEENTATLISLVEGDGATVESGEAYISGADDATVTLGTPTYSNLPAGVVPGTPGISLVQTATGYDVSITPGTAFDALAEGESMLMEIPYTVEDSDGDTVTKVIVVTVTGTNDQPVITSGAQNGSVEETADVVGGADPDPAAATGIISFLDVDLSDDPEASHDGGTVTNMSFADGYTPTDAQIAALKAGFTLDDATLSNFSNTTGVGSTGWTYQVANSVVDFLGDGDSVELTYVVTIDDGNGGTVTQNVVVTLTGTSDAPTVSAADDFVVNEADLTNGNSDALIFTGDVGLNFNDYSSVGLSARLKTSGAIPLNPAGDLILMSSDGLQLGYSLLTRPSAGQQILSGFNFRTGEIIFVLDVKIVADGSGGFKVEYTFELRGNLDHIGPGDGNSMPLDFTVTATNSAGETAQNTFTVTINDDAPDAANVTATMEENTATLISLVEGDGADLDPGEAYISGADDVTVTLGTPTYSNLPAGVVPGAPGLSLVQTATGYDVSVTPGTAFDALADGESMLMEIPFTVEDRDGDTVTKVIVVTITGTNDLPVIAAQTDVSEILTETDAALSTAGSFDVVDVDVSDVVTITEVTVAASGTGVNAATPDAAALLAMFGPSSGVVIDGLSSSGTVNWTFDAGNGAFDYLKAGESLELTYTVNVADGHGGLVDQDVTITINGTNDVPVVAPITQPTAVAELADASAQDISPITGTISVTDADAGETLTAQAGTPVISWSGGVLSAAQQAALTAALASGALTLGGPVSSDSSAGIGYSWDPSAADLDFLAQGQTLTVSYDITVSDGTATSAAQPLVFTIAGSNDLPDAFNDNPNGSLPEFRMSEDETVAKAFDVLSNDILDPDAGAANSISLGTIRGYGVPGLAGGSVIDPVASGLFTITVDGNNQIQVQLNTSAWQSMRRGESAKIVIDYRLEGDGTDFALGSLQVEVRGTNDAPVLDVAASPAMTQAEDAAQPSGDVGTLISTLVSAPGGSVGNVNDVDGRGFAPGISITAFDTSHGTWYYHIDGVNASNGDPYWFNANLTGQVLNLRAQDKIYFVPDPDYTGTIDQAITFRAWDGVASQLGKISAPGSVGGETAYSTDIDTVSLTVDNVNDAPVLAANISDETVLSSTDLDIDLTGSFSDIDPGDVLSYSATLANGDPLPAWLSIDGATGRLTGTAPAVGPAGETLQITVTATDTGNLSVSDTFELTIDHGNDTPVITAHTDGGVTEDASYAGGTNLITNGGFETGNSSGWSVSGTYVSGYYQYVHTGAYAVGGWSVYAPYNPATLSQTFTTVAGATYTVSFWVQNNGNATPNNSLNVTLNGANVASIVDLAYVGPLPNYTEFTYTFTATSDSSTLAFAIENRVNYTFVDDISVVRQPGTETTSGTISFTDLDVGDTHTASFTPAGGGYLGSFAAIVGAESSGGSTGTVNWTFSVADADIQHLAAGETVTQTYTVTIDDGNGGTVSEDIDVTLTGVNDDPTLTGLDGVTFLENTVNNAPQLIDADVAFGDIDTGNLDGGTLTVSGFVSGEDTIGINNQGAGAGHVTLSGANVLFGGTVIGTFTGGSGANNLVVTFNSSATAAAVDALIENLTYANSSDTPTASRTLTIAVTDGDGGSVSATSVVDVTEEADVPAAVAASDFINPIPVGWTWLADNGHIYKYVATNHFWTGAVTAAAGEIAGQSYLATSTSAAEDALIDTLATGRTHLGGSDATTEGTWQWMTGPEAGQVFWIGGVGGSAQNGAFINWSPSNPGNVSGYGSAENYLATDLSDNWNDVDGSNSGLPTIGYMAEAGGLNGQTYAAITEDAAFTFSESWLLANDINAPGNILSVSASTKGASVSYNAGTGEITYNAIGSAELQALGAGETTTDSFTYTIADGNGGVSSATVTLTVAGADEVPVTGDAGENNLAGGAGGDLINGGAGRDTLTGADGADVFVFDNDALLDATVNGIRDLIADYDYSEGDVVDLSVLLGDETVVGHEADYVQMNGNFLEIDIDGAGGPAGFVQIAEFGDVPATNGLRILVDDDPAVVSVVI